MCAALHARCLRLPFPACALDGAPIVLSCTSRVCGRHGAGTTTTVAPSQRPRVFLNLRDMCQAMDIPASHRRALTLAAVVGSLPEDIRPE
jgi:hypothetical protein